MVQKSRTALTRRSVLGGGAAIAGAAVMGSQAAAASTLGRRPLGGRVPAAPLPSELWQTDVEIQAVLEQISLPLREGLNLEVGTHIALNATPHSLVKMHCGGIPMFDGSMGRKGRNIAIRVEQRTSLGSDPG